MSSVPFYGPTATGPASGRLADIRSVIAVAAQSTGVDFNYLLAQARLESNLDPAARAATSSAAGLYQFTGGTWLATLDRHGASHGLGWAEQAIEGGRVVDPALHGQIMALRHDPQIAALMAGELANDNRATLSAALGREPDSAELYLAHFLGADGATRFLGALAVNPGQSAAAVLPRAAAANHTIFYDRSGAPRSVGAVMDLLRTRLHAAMEGGAGPALPPLPGSLDRPFAAVSDPAPAWAGSVGQEFNARQGQKPGATPGATPGTAPGAATRATPQRVSMADTLRSAFDLGDGSAAPGHVRAAYGRLRAMGL